MWCKLLVAARFLSLPAMAFAPGHAARDQNVGAASVHAGKLVKPVPKPKRGGRP